MNFAKARAVDAVARTSGFSRAGHELGLSQQAVTIQVRSLEQGFGVQLFRRRGRHVEMAELGQHLFEHTCRLFGIESEAYELLRSGKQLLSGEVNLAADGPYAVMGLVSRFRQEHPEVRVNLRLGNSGDCLAQLVDQRADLALASEVPQDRHIHALPYIRQPLMPLLPAAHPWAWRDDLPIDALEGSVMVMRERASSTRALFERHLARRQIKVRTALEFDTREAVREAVAMGLGFDLALENELGIDGRLRAVPIESGSIICTDYLACLAGQSDRRVVAAFFALAATGRGADAGRRD